MSTRRARRVRSARPTAGAGVGDTVRQVGTFEAANGIPHGVFGIVLALVAAVIAATIGAIWRAVRPARR